MADDHAAHAMSCYGGHLNQTPNLDRIAAEGALLTNCFCTNSICTPSRATILTGKYSHIHGAITFNAPDPSHVTFPNFNTPAHWGVRTRDHKLIYYHESDEWECYDMTRDPMEMENLYGRKEYAATIAELKEEIVRLREACGDDDASERNRRLVTQALARVHPHY